MLAIVIDLGCRIVNSDAWEKKLELAKLERGEIPLTGSLLLSADDAVREGFVTGSKLMAVSFNQVRRMFEMTL